VVIGNASRVSTLTRSGATFTVAGSYAPGLVLSPVLVFSGSGSIYVSASDRRLHKLSLSSAAEVGSVAVASQAPAVNLGPPAFDPTNNMFVFGSSDGHLWAVPFF
jgi:hypothetical protein